MNEDVDLTAKTNEQLQVRLDQLHEVAKREGQAGEKFEDLFEIQFVAEREILLILIEIARRTLRQEAAA